MLAAPMVKADSVTVSITVDNGYGFGYGDQNGIYTQQYYGGLDNCTAAEIFGSACYNFVPPDGTVPDTGPEIYNITASSSDFIYIVAWSDDAVAQGAVASFTDNDTGTIVTTSPAWPWQVFATGINWQPDCGGSAHGPPLTGSPDAINSQIAAANANAGTPGTSSVGWVGANGGANGSLYFGGTGNAYSDFNYEAAVPACIAPAAQWMEYDPEPTNPNCNPFEWGSVNDYYTTANFLREYLIYRIGPLSQLTSSNVCTNECINIYTPTNIVVNACSNTPVFFTASAADTCCSNVTVVCTPPSGSYFAPGTTTVTCDAFDACGHSNFCSFDVTLVCTNNGGGCDGCCGTNLGTRIIQWLQLPTNGTTLTADPSGANGNNTWIVTNLPGYGNVLITQNAPANALASFTQADPYLDNPPGSDAIFNFTEPGYGPYTWGVIPGTFGMYNTATLANLNYNVNFYFLDGPPNLCQLVLGVDGLGEYTTVTASQSMTFRTEYDLTNDFDPYYPDEPSAYFTLDGAIPSPSGSNGTVVGSAYSLDGYGDTRNTGLAILQFDSSLQTLTTNAVPTGSGPGWPGLAANVPFVTLGISAQNGDGFGVTLGYIICTNSNSNSNCVPVIECPSNMVVQACSNVPVFYSPAASDTCGGDVTVVCTPPSGSYFAPETTTPVNCVATDASGNSNSCSFTVTVQCAVVTNYVINIGTGFNLIANQLDNGGNTLGEIFTNVPDGSVVYKYENLTATWSSAFFRASTATWIPGGITLNPGEGAWFESPSNFTLTLTGIPNVPALPIATTNGQIYLLSRQTNDVGNYENIVGAEPAKKATLYRWNNAAASYESFTYPGTLSDTNPSVDIGEAVWIAPSGGQPPLIAGGPIIAQSPHNVVAIQGTPVTLSVGAVGTPPLSYQWSMNGVPIAGAIEPSLSFPSVSLSDAGSYSVAVEDGIGTTISPIIFMEIGICNGCGSSSSPPDFGDLPASSVAAYLYYSYASDCSAIYVDEPATIVSTTVPVQYQTFLSDNGPEHYFTQDGIWLGSAVSATSDGTPSPTAFLDPFDGDTNYWAVSSMQGQCTDDSVEENGIRVIPQPSSSFYFLAVTNLTDPRTNALGAADKNLFGNAVTYNSGYSLASGRHYPAYATTSYSPGQTVWITIEAYNENSDATLRAEPFYLNAWMDYGTDAAHGGLAGQPDGKFENDGEYIIQDLPLWGSDMLQDLVRYQSYPYDTSDAKTRANIVADYYNGNGTPPVIPDIGVQQYAGMGLQVASFVIPPSLNVGPGGTQTYARFRISRQPMNIGKGNTYGLFSTNNGVIQDDPTVGLVNDSGEVEDYSVLLTQSPPPAPQPINLNNLGSSYINVTTAQLPVGISALSLYYPCPNLGNLPAPMLLSLGPTELNLMDWPCANPPEPRVFSPNSYPYILQVANTGISNMTGVSVTYTAPTNGTLYTAGVSQGTTAQQAGTASFNIGELDAGQQAYIGFNVTPTESGVVTQIHQFQISADQPLQNPEEANSVLTNIVAVGSNSPATNSTVVFAGLSNSPVGAAVIAATNNGLLVSNLGSSGQDGLSIALPPGLLALNMHWLPLDPSNTLPVGAYIREQTIGSANGITNGVLGTVTVTKLGSGQYGVSADFSPVGGSSYTAQAYNDGSLAGQGSSTNGGQAGIALQIPEANYYDPLLFMGHPWLSLDWYVNCYCQNFQFATGVFVDATVMNFTPLNVTLTNTPTAYLITASQVPAITITSENASYLFGSLASTALGNASLAPVCCVSNLGSSGQDGLAVANLGSSGQDGVAVAFPTNVSAVDLQFLPADSNNTLPVGASIQGQVIGNAAGITNGVLGTITATKSSATNTTVSADFSPIGAGTVSVQAYLYGTLVGQAAGLPGAAVMRSSGGGGGGSGLPTSWIIAVDTNTHPQTLVFGVDYENPAPQYLTIGTSATPVLANKFLITPENASTTSAVTGGQITAVGVPSLTMQGVSVSPLLLNASRTGQNLTLQWYGTGLLQSTAHLSGTNWTIDAAATSPFTVPLGATNQYYRINQTAP
jgi:hypothetical protein